MYRFCHELYNVQINSSLNFRNESLKSSESNIFSFFENCLYRFEVDNEQKYIVMRAIDRQLHKLIQMEKEKEQTLNKNNNKIKLK